MYKSREDQAKGLLKRLNQISFGDYMIAKTERGYYISTTEKTKLNTEPLTVEGILVLLDGLFNFALLETTKMGVLQNAY